MNTMENQTLLRRLSIVFRIAFISLTVFYFLFIAYYSRLSADDYSSLGLVKEYGVFGSVWHLYMHWEAPPLGILFFETITYFFGFSHNLLLYTLFSLVFYYFVMSYFWVSVYKSLQLKIDYVNIFFLSAVILSAFYFATPDIGMIWHWRIGNVGYVLMPLFLIMGLALLIRKKEYLSLFPFMMFMHSRITWVIIFLCIYFVAIFFIKVTETRKKHIILFVVLSIVALIYVVGPGNYVRHHGYMAHQHAPLLLVFTHFLTRLYIIKMSYAMLFLFLLLPYCKDLFKKVTTLNIPFVLPIVVLLFGTGMQMIVLYFVINDFYLTDRVWSLFTLTAIFVTLYYCSFLFVKFEKHISKIVLFVFFIAAGASNYLYIKTIINEKKRIKVFAEQYDKRLQYILAQKSKHISCLSVEPLPDPGILYYEEFSKDPKSWINTDFKRAFALDFDIKLDTSIHTK
jgi:hypothetical protein